LRIRPFAVLWSGQTLSRVGDSIHTIASAWLILQMTGSAAAMGTVLVAQTLPFLLLSLVGGVTVDRVPRLWVMFVSDGVRMAVVAVISILVYVQVLQFWHLLALAIVFGSVDAFFYPAYVAVVPELVPADDRASANSLTVISRRFAALIGPGVGSALVAAGGTAAAFGVDAVTFGVSAILIVAAQRSASSAPNRTITRPIASGSQGPGDDGSLETGARVGPVQRLRGALRVAGHELAAGFATVRDESWIWVTIIVAGVTGITLAGPLEAVLPLLVVRHLGGGVEVLGLLQTLIGAGAIGATIVLGSRRRLHHRGAMLYGAWIVFALAMAVAGYPVGVAGAAIAAAMIGACGSIVGLTWTSALQDLVPSERLGRVASIDALGSSALEPVGYIAAGAAADQIGPAAVFVAGGLVSAGILSLALLDRSIRHLD
jgi:DHA3 family tetracycline resistance protein-like MFS transporter